MQNPESVLNELTHCNKGNAEAKAKTKTKSSSNSNNDSVNTNTNTQIQAKKLEVHLTIPNTPQALTMFADHSEEHKVLHPWNPDLVKSLYGIKPGGGKKPQLVHLDNQRYASSSSANKGTENKVAINLFDYAIECHAERQLLILNAGGSCGSYFKGEIEHGELTLELGAGAAAQFRIFENDFTLPQGKISVAIDVASVAGLMRATTEFGHKMDVLAGVEVGVMGPSINVRHESGSIRILCFLVDATTEIGMGVGTKVSAAIGGRFDPEKWQYKGILELGGFVGIGTSVKTDYTISLHPETITNVQKFDQTYQQNLRNLCEQQNIHFEQSVSPLVIDERFDQLQDMAFMQAVIDYIYKKLPDVSSADHSYYGAKVTPELIGDLVKQYSWFLPEEKRTQNAEDAKKLAENHLRTQAENSGKDETQHSSSVLNQLGKPELTVPFPLSSLGGDLESSSDFDAQFLSQHGPQSAIFTRPMPDLMAATYLQSHQPTLVFPQQTANLPYSFSDKSTVPIHHTLSATHLPSAGELFSNLDYKQGQQSLPSFSADISSIRLQPSTERPSMAFRLGIHSQSPHAQFHGVGYDGTNGFHDNPAGSNYDVDAGVFHNGQSAQLGVSITRHFDISEDLLKFSGLAGLIFVGGAFIRHQVRARQTWNAMTPNERRDALVQAQVDALRRSETGNYDLQDYKYFWRMHRCQFQRDRLNDIQNIMRDNGSAPEERNAFRYLRERLQPELLTLLDQTPKNQLMGKLVQRFNDELSPWIQRGLDTLAQPGGEKYAQSVGRMIIKEDSSNPVGYYILGAALEKQDHRTAIHYLNLARLRAPADETAYYEKYLLMRIRHDPNKRVIFSEIQKVMPDKTHESLIYNCALTFENSGYHSEAKSLFDTLKERATNDHIKVNALIARARIAEKEKDFPIVIDCLGKMISIDPSNYNLQVSLAKAELTNGDTQKSKDRLTEIANNPRVPKDMRAICFETLYQIARKEKRTAEANQHLASANVLDPENFIRLKTEANDRVAAGDLLGGAKKLSDCVAIVEKKLQSANLQSALSDQEQLQWQAELRDLNIKYALTTIQGNTKKLANDTQLSPAEQNALLKEIHGSAKILRALAVTEDDFFSEKKQDADGTENKAKNINDYSKHLIESYELVDGDYSLFVKVESIRQFAANDDHTEAYRVAKQLKAESGKDAIVKLCDNVIAGKYEHDSALFYGPLTRIINQILSDQAARYDRKLLQHIAACSSVCHTIFPSVSQDTVMMCVARISGDTSVVWQNNVKSHIGSQFKKVTSPFRGFRGVKPNGVATPTKVAARVTDFVAVSGGVVAAIASQTQFGEEHRIGVANLATVSQAAATGGMLIRAGKYVGKAKYAKLANLAPALLEVGLDSFYSWRDFRCSELNLPEKRDNFTWSDFFCEILAQYFPSNPGTLPEDPYDYFMRDYKKLFVAGVAGAAIENPLPFIYFLGKAGMNLYYLRSKYFDECALQAMIKNATYFWNQNNFETAEKSINNMILTFRGCYVYEYQATDSYIVKQSKIFVLEFQCANAKHQDNEKEILGRTEYGEFNDIYCFKHSKCPVVDVPNVLFSRLKVIAYGHVNDSSKNQKGNLNKGYRRYEVLDDGNCGYTAFGITREEAYHLMNAHINDIRDLLKLVIKEQLLANDFMTYLKQNEAIADNVTLEQIEKNSEQYAINLNIVQAYINYDIRDGKIDAGWAHPAVLQALAHIQGIELHIWQLGENDMLVPHQQGYATYSPQNATTRADLLFINGNHFERLDIRGGYDGEIYPLKIQKRHINLPDRTASLRNEVARLIKIFEEDKTLKSESKKHCINMFRAFLLEYEVEKAAERESIDLVFSLTDYILEDGVYVFQQSKCPVIHAPNVLLPRLAFFAHQERDFRHNFKTVYDEAHQLISIFKADKTLKQKDQETIIITIEKFVYNLHCKCLYNLANNQHKNQLAALIREFANVHFNAEDNNDALLEPISYFYIGAVKIIIGEYLEAIRNFAKINIPDRTYLHWFMLYDALSKFSANVQHAEGYQKLIAMRLCCCQKILEDLKDKRENEENKQLFLQISKDVCILSQKIGSAENCLKDFSHDWMVVLNEMNSNKTTGSQSAEARVVELQDDSLRANQAPHAQMFRPSVNIPVVEKQTASTLHHGEPTLLIAPHECF